VITAADGLEGISRYRDLWREVDLVILDMVMPNLSGGDCFRRMKGINPKARVVLSSGYSMDGAVQDVMKRGSSRSSRNRTGWRNSPAWSNGG